jgi:RNA polymerase sigma-70 factor (ECF subfamily)
LKAVELYTDEELLNLLKDSNKDAFVLIYRKFWSSLYNAAYKRLRDTARCQDVVQNVFTDLWLRKDRVDIRNLPAYLHTAVRFQVYKEVVKQPSNSEFFKVLEEILVSPFQSDAEVINKELSDLVTLWIEALPAKRRKIFLMHFYEELSTDEIARRLNVSQKTVQNQLNTASTQIRARFAHFLSVAVFISGMY